MTPDSEVPGLAEKLPELEASLQQDDSPRNVMRVAEALRMSGQSSRAVELLRPVVSGEPTRIAPRVLLAWCLEDQGQVDAAQEILESVRALDPGNPFAREPEPSRPVRSAFVDRPEEGVFVDVPAPPEVPRDPETEAEPEQPLTPGELSRVPPGPLYSATLAEIFEKQGFEGKAIEIYEEVVRRHPDRRDLKDRIVDLRAREAEGASG